MAVCLSRRTSPSSALWSRPSRRLRGIAYRQSVPERVFVTTGGLVSYGTDRLEQYRGAASYVDRILRGEKAGDLPFQQPTKYELVINLATAKTLGLTIPPTLLFKIGRASCRERV